MTQPFTGIDPNKVQSVVARCTDEGVDEYTALGIVVETANRYGIQLTEDEEGEAAQQLLAQAQATS